MFEGSVTASLQCFRSARWEQQSNKHCDAGCEIFESLGHMIQKCPRTERPRSERHNNNVKILEREFEGREEGIQMRNLAFHTNQRWSQNPDLCAWEEEQCIVSDVASAADTADLNLDLVHERIAAKYDMPDILACRRMSPQTSENQTQL